MPKMPIEIGKLDSGPDRHFRHLLTEVLRRACRRRKKRLADAEIAEALSACVGWRVTVAQLNDWTAKSKLTRFFPAYLVRPLCEVLGDDRLQRLIMGPELSNLVRLGERNKRLLRRVRRKKGRA
jgi:hypothetical protein